MRKIEIWYIVIGLSIAVTILSLLLIDDYLRKEEIVIGRVADFQTYGIAYGLAPSRWVIVETTDNEKIKLIIPDEIIFDDGYCYTDLVRFRQRRNIARNTPQKWCSKIMEGN